MLDRQLVIPHPFPFEALSVLTRKDISTFSPPQISIWLS